MVRPAGIEPARLAAADFLTRYCSRSRIARGNAVWGLDSALTIASRGRIAAPAL